MAETTVRPQKIVIDREKLSELNSQGYAGKFTLGETVVLACGGWEGGPRYIPEKEAIYDEKTQSYVERKCYSARKIND